jgi:hypothetical protein
MQFSSNSLSTETWHKLSADYVNKIISIDGNSISYFNIDINFSELPTDTMLMSIAVRPSSGADTLTTSYISIDEFALEGSISYLDTQVRALYRQSIKAIFKSRETNNTF